MLGTSASWARNSSCLEELQPHHGLKARACHDDVHPRVYWGKLARRGVGEADELEHRDVGQTVIRVPALGEDRPPRSP